MIRSAKDLSPGQKEVIEGLLGRQILEDETLSIRAIESQELADKDRAEVLKGLEEYFAQVDAQRQPISSAEADEILDEALRAARPSYRSIR